MCRSQEVSLRYGGMRFTCVDVRRMVYPRLHTDLVHSGLFVAHACYEQLVQQVRASLSPQDDAVAHSMIFLSSNGSIVAPDNYHDFFPSYDPYAEVPLHLSCMLFRV